MSINFNKFNKISDYVSGLNIDDVKNKYGLKKVVKLASNENPFSIPFRILKKIKNILPDIKLYPDMEYKQLKNKLSGVVNLNTDEIIIGNGSDEIFDLIFKAFINKTSKVIIPAPSFSIYNILTAVYSAKPVFFKLEEKNRFAYNIDKLLKKINSTIDAVILCNPNNPTGTYIDENDLLKIVSKISNNTLLVVDEAYFDFTDKNDFPDMVKIIRGFKNKNIIVVRTFSKLYGMAGLRLGYAFSIKKIIRILNKIRMPFNVNIIAEKTAQIFLDDNSFTDMTFKNVLTNKLFLYNELEKINIEYVPSEANFILIKVKPSGKSVFQQLLKKGIIVRSYSDSVLKNYIRVSIGTRKEMIKFIKELKKTQY